MGRAAEAVIVDAPIGDVFALLEDGTRNALWQPEVVSSERVDDSPRERAIWLQTSRTPNGRTRTSDYRVSWYEPEERIEFNRIAGGPASVENYDLSDLGDGRTRVELTVDVTPRGIFLLPGFIGRGAARRIAQRVYALRDAFATDAG